MNQEPCNDENFTLVADLAGCEFARPLNRFEECAEYVGEFGGGLDAPTAQQVFFDAIYGEGCSASGPDCQRLLDRFASFREQELTQLRGLDLRAIDDQAGGTVYITEYPGVTRDESGESCPANAIDVMPGWSDAELVWVDTVVAPRLNEIVSQAAQDGGWNLIGGIYDGFSTHGLCADEHWVVHLQESFLAQGDPSGSIHPNRAGNAYYGTQIADALRQHFYPDGDLDLPRRAN